MQSWKMWHNIFMKLITQVKLTVTQKQQDALLDTLEQTNAACNYLSDHAWENQVFKQYDLHHACYYAVREKFELSAQTTVRAIAKVSDAYRVCTPSAKLDKKRKRKFKQHGSIAYDERILSWNTEGQSVSIWTTDGRKRIPFLAGEKQLQLLEHRQGEADLIYRGGEWYLHQVCEVVESDEFDPTGWLGVDLGIVSIATTSDGDIYTGEVIETKRKWYERRRAILQQVGTKSAKRRLKQISGKQARYQRHENHCVSKSLVETAKGTQRGIALENLKGIRARTQLRRGQRSRHHNWAFHQLQSFLSYKAKLAGVPIQKVDPKHTSQTCPSCGYIAKSNRRSQSQFFCVQCGFVGHADHVAAINIAARASVNMPMVSPNDDKGYLPIASSLEGGDNAPQLAAE
ncbi:MAG: transposase [Anaerolineales bacterium]